jgi:transposase
MAGIDLHSNNLFCAIVNMDGKRVFEKRLPCELESVLQALKPFKRHLEKIVVESTYNWYWLVDGLQDRGYTVVLANPAAMEQYNGHKHADDRSDGFLGSPLNAASPWRLSGVCRHLKWNRTRRLI